MASSSPWKSIRQEPIRDHPQFVAFAERLRALGYTEHHNVEFVVRAGPVERLPELADDLVALKPDVILAWSTIAVRALKPRTASIPIVIGSGGDPVELGLVASLSRPGGNVTGVAAVSLGIQAKSMELLRELVPGVTRIGVLWESTNPNSPEIRKALDASASALNLTMELVEAPTVADLPKAFDLLASKRVPAILVTTQPRNYEHAREIAQLALKHRLPAMFGEPVSVRSGGLMAYTPDWVDLSRKAANYVDRILRGVKPGDLPIEFSRKFELLINMRTAKSLGLSIPPSVLLRADQVIE